jgi:hypothetical protein
LKRSQSVQDALADAETLRLALPDGCLLDAPKVRFWLRSLPHATSWGRNAAHAAFAAVPALRAAQQEEA